MTARLRRRISSSVFPENMGPQMISRTPIRSSTPWPCLAARALDPAPPAPRRQSRLARLATGPPNKLQVPFSSGCRGRLVREEAHPEVRLHAAAVLARARLEEGVAHRGGPLAAEARALPRHAALLAPGALDGLGDAGEVDPQVLLPHHVEPAQAGGLQLAAEGAGAGREHVADGPHLRKRSLPRRLVPLGLPLSLPQRPPARRISC